MQNQEFLIWEDDYIEGYCVIESPEGIKKAYQLGRGISRLSDWPSDIICRMNDEFPKDIQCADSLYGAGIRVVSEQVKDFLIFEGLDSVEFLAVTILNHKGRIVSENYFIVNPSYVVDCVDLKASQVRWNSIKTDLINGCEQLILKKEDIPDREKVFRPKYLPIIILIRADLAKKLTDAGFSGFFFKDPLKYRGI